MHVNSGEGAAIMATPIPLLGVEAGQLLQEKSGVKMGVLKIDEKLSELFKLYYGSDAVIDTFVLAEKLGVDVHVCVDLMGSLQKRLHSELGFVDDETLKLVCPECLKAFVKVGEKRKAVLIKDFDKGETVCTNCGFVVSSFENGKVEPEDNYDDSKAFGEEWQPGNELNVGGGKGATLNSYNQSSDSFSADRALQTILGKGAGNITFENIKPFQKKHPEAFQQLTDPCKPATYKFLTNDITGDCLPSDKILKKIIESFNLLDFTQPNAHVVYRYLLEAMNSLDTKETYVYKYRCYTKGPAAGLKFVAKVPLHDFELYGEKAFDCIKIRIQRVNNLVNVELPGQDALIIMGKNLGKLYGLGPLSVKLHPQFAIFNDAFGTNIKSAFKICERHGYKVSNKVLVETMFLLTLQQFNYENLEQFKDCKKNLQFDYELNYLVSQIDNFVKVLQKSKTKADAKDKN